MTATIWGGLIFIAGAVAFAGCLINAWSNDTKYYKLVNVIIIALALIFVASVRISFRAEETEIPNSTVLKTEVTGNRSNPACMVWVSTDNENSVCINVEKDAYGLFKEGNTVTVIKTVNHTWLFGAQTEWSIKEGGN